MIEFSFDDINGQILRGAKNALSGDPLTLRSHDTYKHSSSVFWLYVKHNNTTHHMAPHDVHHEPGTRSTTPRVRTHGKQR
eukprot:m.705447 g.705447  ORF g.705447 m.705447 type:complete len:80 (+) comp22926_c0_seq25:1687-1926(+)